VWEEAENRLHVQKALMEYLLCGRLDWEWKSKQENFELFVFN
jgi:hypothetical protein